MSEVHQNTCITRHHHSLTHTQLIGVSCESVEPGRFFFPHHAALASTLLKIIKISPLARRMVMRSLEALLARAVRVPLRAHTRPSRASLYLLCTVASEFRADLSRLKMATSVLHALVGEETLAATILQLYWKRKYTADQLAKANEAGKEKRRKKKEKMKEEALAERKKAAGLAARKEREAAEAAAHASNASTDEEKVAAMAAAKKHREEMEEEEGDESDEEPTNPFQERQKMISSFHRSHATDLVS